MTGALPGRVSTDLELARSLLTPWHERNNPSL